MDYFLAIFGGLLILIGIIGCIIPGIPGPPLSYLGLLLLHWTRFAQISFTKLIVWAVIVIFVTVMDYIVPVWGTKKSGGTAAGVRGSTIGLIIGVLLLPLLGITLGPFGLFGILGGPFIGAWIGERFAGQNSDRAFKAAFGSFIGFMAGTLMKLSVSIILAVLFFKAIGKGS